MGETGREKDVGESQGPFWEAGGELRPRQGGFRTQEEGEQAGGDPARLSQSPMPHPGLAGGSLVGQILPRLWLGAGVGVKAKRGRSERAAICSHLRGN